MHRPVNAANRSSATAMRVVSPRACLRTPRGPARRDFGGGQGGEAGASPKRAATAEPTPATGKRPVARRVFEERARWLRCSSVTGPPGTCFLVAPRHRALSSKTGPLGVLKQALWERREPAADWCSIPIVVVGRGVGCITELILASLERLRKLGLGADAMPWRGERLRCGSASNPKPRKENSVSRPSSATLGYCESLAALLSGISIDPAELAGLSQPGRDFLEICAWPGQSSLKTGDLVRGTTWFLV